MSTAAPTGSSTRSSSRMGCVVRQIDVADPAAFEARPRTRARGSSGSSRRRTRGCSCMTSRRSARPPIAMARSSSSTTLSPRRCFSSPSQLGADIVVHSVTKYLARPLGSDPGSGARERRGRVRAVKFLQNATGAVPSPFDCWLTLRGLKTLELRMQRHADNAEAIAEALVGHPLVRSVSTSRDSPTIRDTKSRDDR